eukprot:PITA_27450
MQLHKRYSNLHVYAYGVLPCVDAVVADACSSFVTSIIYNDEFSARLSATSILRLRAAALGALAADSSTDSAVISKLARRLLHANKYLWGTNCEEDSVQTSQSGSMVPRDNNQRHKQRRFKYKIKGAESRDKLSFDECTVLIEDSDTENHDNNQQDASYKDEVYSNELHAHYTDIVIENGTSGDSISQPVNTDLGPDVSEAEPVEMFVPGLVIHIIPEAKQTTWPSWKNLNWLHRADASHRAILRHRESFKDIIVSPSMFLDHVPWR